MKRLLYILLLSMLGSCGADEPAVLDPSPWQDGDVALDDTVRVLLIGNSFASDAVDSHLDKMLDEAGIPYVIGRLHKQAASLAETHNYLVKHTKAYEYLEIRPDHRVQVEGVASTDVVRSQPWNIVSVQQVSSDAGQFKSYASTLPKLLPALKSCLPTHTRIALHQPWAYPRYCRERAFKPFKYDQLAMYAAIVDATRRAMWAYPFDMLVPSGTAIQIARDDQVLNADARDLCRDDFHLDIVKGRYVAALVCYECITGMDCRNLAYRPEGMDADMATHARMAAHTAVMQYTKSPSHKKC